jgi:hypothetical protein
VSPGPCQAPRPGRPGGGHAARGMLGRSRASTPAVPDPRPAHLRRWCPQTYTEGSREAGWAHPPGDGASGAPDRDCLPRSVLGEQGIRSQDAHRPAPSVGVGAGAPGSEAAPDPLRPAGRAGPPAVPDPRPCRPPGRAGPPAVPAPRPPGRAGPPAVPAPRTPCPPWCVSRTKKGRRQGDPAPPPASGAPGARNRESVAVSCVGRTESGRRLGSFRSSCAGRTTAPPAPHRPGPGPPRRELPTAPRPAAAPGPRPASGTGAAPSAPG